jgi:hypothetical protein
MKVKIPFQERWRGAMLEQHKVCTSRNKRYGKPGDTFQAFDADFEIVAGQNYPPGCEQEPFYAGRMQQP